MKVREIMQYIVLAAFMVMVGCYLYYQKFKHKPGSGLKKRIAVKCTATLMAALVALLGAIESGLPAHFVVLCGIVICAIADGVLCAHFMLGAGVFALGHVALIVGFSMMHLPGWGSLLTFICLMMLITFLCEKWKRRMGRRAPMFFGYGIMLCLMTAVSAAQRPLFFAGGLLFAISDGLLAWQLFNRVNLKIDYFSLGCYYLAQFLMALGIFLW